MESRRSPAAAQSAAVLGSRNARRQLRSVLTAAAEAGAYSVGFCVARGGLTGFSVYFAGDFAGAGKHQHAGTAAYSCAVPRTSRLEATIASAQPTARAPAASTAPALPAAARRRGCRAGDKVQQRRRSDCARLPPATAIAAADVPLEGGTNAARSCGKACMNMTVTAAPSAPPLHDSYSLSPLAPAFSPSPRPCPPSSPSPSKGEEEEDPLSHPPDLRHLLPHARLSFEEQRWEHYISYGGPFPPHGSSKKRRDPPSPALSSPSSSIIGCVVNERRPRAAPPSPNTPPSPLCASAERPVLCWIPPQPLSLFPL